MSSEEQKAHQYGASGEARDAMPRDGRTAGCGAVGKKSFEVSAVMASGGGNKGIFV